MVVMQAFGLAAMLGGRASVRGAARAASVCRLCAASRGERIIIAFIAHIAAYSDLILVTSWNRYTT
eukprot:4851695-Pleurochrysis_carterae.AAC.4